jgi:diacylglycerol kinase (ATP)
VHWEIRETSAPGDGVKLAAEAAALGADLVAAAGGDGTLGEVVNGLAGTGTRLGVIPLGTGNDFVRTLGLRADDLPGAVHTLFHGTPKPIDLGRCGDRWFLNVAGCGFDAVVAERVNRGFRRLRGTSTYLAALCQSLLAFRPAAFTLTLDGETRTQRAMLCSVANARAYGGGMLIAPDAQLDDGLFDVCLLGEVGTLEFLRAFPRVFRGTHTSHPKVTMLRARHVRVESDPPLPVFVDGEVIGRTPTEFTLAPRALEVMTPPI